jgi:hypothetical protein
MILTAGYTLMDALTGALCRGPWRGYAGLTVIVQYGATRVIVHPRCGEAYPRGDGDMPIGNGGGVLRLPARITTAYGGGSGPRETECYANDQ